MTSARTEMMDAFLLHAKAVNNQRYLVKRGVMNYSALDWNQYPRSWAIQVDEGSLFNSSPVGGYSAWITFEVFASIGDHSVDPLIDDNLTEELLSDVLEVIESTLKTKNSQGDPVLFQVPRGSGKFLESHDTTLGVQGVIATFEVSF